MTRLYPTLILCLLTAACEPDDSGHLRLRSGLEVAAANLDFGELVVGQQVQLPMALHNRGQLGLQLEVQITGSGSAAYWVNPPRLYLDVSQEAALDVGFSPPSIDRFTAQLLLLDTQSVAPLARVELHGRGTSPDCDDHNDCTHDDFDPASGGCVHTARSGSCDDADACTSNDHCAAGMCVGERVSCDDNLECTRDTCDAALGCVAIPEHERCVDDNPCTDDICDAELGCHNPRAVDGTLCGELSCAELKVCISGRCHVGPAPDHMPCDDGDPCSSGDSCLAGVCLPGELRGETGVSTAREIVLDAPDREFNIAQMPNAVAVLAIGATTHGGVDVVWAHNNPDWSTTALTLVRTRIGPDLQVQSHGHLGTAHRAWAHFQDETLILLTLQPWISQDDCENCADEEAPEYQQWVLQVRGPDYVSSQDDVVIALDEAVRALGLNVDQEVGAAIASDGSGIYVAFARSYMSALWTVAGITAVGLDGQGLLSWPIDPDVYEHAMPMQRLSLRTEPQMPIQLGFLQDRSSPDARFLCEQCCPQGAHCDCRENYPTASLVSAPFGHSQALRWIDFDVAEAREMQLLQGPAMGGVVLATRSRLTQNGVPQYPEEEEQDPPPIESCESHDVIYGFSPISGIWPCEPYCQEELGLRELLLASPYSVTQVTAFAHNSLPAALVHTHDFGLSVVGTSVTGESWTEGVLPPSVISPRQWAKSPNPSRPLSATLTTATGVLAVAVVESPVQSREPVEGAQLPQRSNGFALFTIGCGVHIPPLVNSD